MNYSLTLCDFLLSPPTLVHLQAVVEVLSCPPQEPTHGRISQPECHVCWEIVAITGPAYTIVKGCSATCSTWLNAGRA